MVSFIILFKKNKCRHYRLMPALILLLMKQYLYWSDFIYMLNQAAGDRQILAKQLNISPHQLSYVTHSGESEGLLFYGNTILPFIDHFPKDTELYRVMTTKPNEKFL